jgi:hypothetical protein
VTRKSKAGALLRRYSKPRLCAVVHEFDLSSYVRRRLTSHPTASGLLENAARQSRWTAQATFIAARRVRARLAKAVGGATQTYALERLRGLEYKEEV